MSIATNPSKITLPENQGWTSILDFLTDKFFRVSEDRWLDRINRGKVHWLSGEAVKPDEVYQQGKVLCYYREVDSEIEIPFKPSIIYETDDFLIADKPHFLPVTPGGQYVNECLLEKLRTISSATDLVPCHRLDKDTAGLVLCAKRVDTRPLYYKLFREKKINKSYRAVAKLDNPDIDIKCGESRLIENRLEKSTPSFLMEEVQGEINAISRITLVKQKYNLGYFELEPVTGKMHQLRLHMLKLGLPILNDNKYPELNKIAPDDFRSPLQLLASKLAFTCPVTSLKYEFKSKYKLDQWL